MKLGSIEFTEGEYLPEEDLIRFKVRSVDVQPGEYVAFRRDFFDHPLFADAKTEKSQIAAAIDRLTKVMSSS